MRISIIPPDGQVYIDGKMYEVAEARKLTRFVAIQWDGEEGHVEYVQPKGEFLPNEKITTIEPFRTVINEALKLAEELPSQPALMPLEMYTYKLRQQYAFSQAKTTDFGVQYSDPVSIGMLTALVALFDKDLLTGSINYKGPNGFISLDKTEMTALAGQVAAHVQKYFNAEKAILEEIKMGTITTHAEIVAAFKAVQ